MWLPLKYRDIEVGVDRGDSHVDQVGNNLLLLLLSLLGSVLMLDMLAIGSVVGDDV